MKRNDKVSHKKFGQGIVRDSQEGRVLVAFGDDDEKWIAESFLVLEQEGEDDGPDHFAARSGPLLTSTIFRMSEKPIVQLKSYEVNKWQWTRCPIGCDDYQENHRCGHQKVFPIPSLVRLSLAEDGSVVKAACAEGRKGEKGACQDDSDALGCVHVKRAIMHMNGEQPEDGSELRRFSCDFRMVMRSGGETMPKCPNCNSRGMVSRDGKRYVCRSGTCMRQDSRGREQPYRFKPGDGKLKPRWSRLSIKEGYKWD